MRVKFVLFILSIMLFSACSKQKIENDLNGYWSVTDWSRDGISQTNSDVEIQLEFSNIQDGKGDLNIHYYWMGGVSTNTGTFHLVDNHARMIACVSNSTSTEEMDYSIEIKKSELTLDGNVTVTEFGTTNTYHINMKARK